MFSSVADMEEWWRWDGDCQGEPKCLCLNPCAPVKEHCALHSLSALSVIAGWTRSRLPQCVSRCCRLCPISTLRGSFTETSRATPFFWRWMAGCVSSDKLFPVFCCCSFCLLLPFCSPSLVFPLCFYSLCHLFLWRFPLCCLRLIFKVGCFSLCTGQTLWFWLLCSDQ